MKKNADIINPITAVVADSNGEIFDLEGYAAVGMAGNHLEILTASETVSMPHGSELLFLPDRMPIVYNLSLDQFETLEENPYQPGEPLFPVAVFNSPGYVNTATCAYEEEDQAGYLPLFSYGAAGWYQDGFCSAAIQVDEEPRQDLRLMKMEKVQAGIRAMRNQLPDNRLRKHLEKCALEYACPAAKNFFIGRCEAPLPTSRKCNARCIGCISLQKESAIKSPQNRITFTPAPEEIAGVALAHFQKVKQGVVSFGQGCEGDPLMAAHVIGPAIAKIRSKTSHGTINMNTNASLPDVLSTLFDQGLDSIRVSMNSARKELYTAYFRPIDYCFEDVEASIDMAIQKGKRVAINYLNCPGVSDSEKEADAFQTFLERHPVNLIQWRNLNFDPFRYWKIMSEVVSLGEPLGMKSLLERIRVRFPEILFGYFNPPKERFEKAIVSHRK
ncbi:MAG: radical SAM protein [Deltaproteobacteria bacterium]|nr:MAG: radical SAM protein [Deltaproteobacteria bacterium]